MVVPELGNVLERGDHGSTFAGAPVAARAALATLDVIDEPQLLAQVGRLGERFREQLGAIDAIDEVRGRGLMVGVTLAEGLDATAVAARALDHGLVINVPGERMLRFLPPLVIEDGDVDEAVELLTRALAS